MSGARQVGPMEHARLERKLKRVERQLQRAHDRFAGIVAVLEGARNRATEWVWLEQVTGEEILKIYDLARAGSRRGRP